MLQATGIFKSADALQLLTASTVCRAYTETLLVPAPGHYTYLLLRIYGLIIPYTATIHQEPNYLC